MLFVGGSDSAA